MRYEKIILKPVLRESSQKRHMHTATSRNKGKTRNIKLHYTKATTTGGRSCQDEYKPRKDSSGNKYNLGLNELVVNPWFVESSAGAKIGSRLNDLRNDYRLSDEWDRNELLKNLVIRKKIPLQRKLEIEAGVDPDTYTEKIPPRPRNQAFYPLDHKKTFLQQLVLKLEGNGNRPIVGDTPLNKMYIQLAKNHPKIAVDKESINDTVHDWYIAREFEDELEAVERHDTEDEAIAKWLQIRKSNPPKVLYMIGSLLLNDDQEVLLKGETNENYIKQSIGDYIKQRSGKQSLRISRFLEIAEIFESNRELFYAKYVTRQALNKSVLYISNGNIIWHSMKTTPEWYKFSGIDAFETFIMDEFSKHDPDDPMIVSAYESLKEELLAKDAKYIE